MMARRSVADVMTRDVATVTEGTPFKEIAVIMAGRGVSALPVLDEQGRVAGIVSEADLLPKEEFQQDVTGRPLPRWRRWGRGRQARAVTARQAMTSPAVTIGPGASVVEAARSMDLHHVKRLPVTGPENRLAGIVSRRDLVRIFVRPDQEIAAEVRDEVLAEYLGANPALVQVTVTEGMVTLAGEVERKSMVPIAGRLALSVDGVVAVDNQLVFAVDDTVPQGPEPDELVNQVREARGPRGPLGG
ncbi:MAG: CBS domain-containing protein [Gemmatimonadota bacterium]